MKSKAKKKEKRKEKYRSVKKAKFKKISKHKQHTCRATDYVNKHFFDDNENKKPKANKEKKGLHLFLEEICEISEIYG